MHVGKEVADVDGVTCLRGSRSGEKCWRIGLPEQLYHKGSDAVLVTHAATGPVVGDRDRLSQLDRAVAAGVERRP